jgi:SAM-dependent methyltransferase
MGPSDLSAQVLHASKLLLRRAGLRSTIVGIIGDRRPMAKGLSIGSSKGWQEAARWLFTPDGEDTLQNPQTMRWLSTKINTLSEVELLLTEFRRILLLDMPDQLERQSVREFVLALLQQCNNNEHVFYVSEPEIKELARIEQRLAQDDLTAAEFENGTILLALYEPIPRLAGKLPRFRDELSNFSSEFRSIVEDLLKRQEEEKEILANLATLRPIEEETSQRVSQWYEKYPYPRWVNIRSYAPGSRQGILREHFSDAELAFLEKPFKVLVAGCGTGRKAIQVAQVFADTAVVTAIDLSRPSLAYAARNAQSLGVTNINFLHADILDVSRLETQFDIVECTGVLHHMGDPLEGWRQLTDVTRSGGLQHISLYSALSRAILDELRKDAGFGVGQERVSPEFIRNYRRGLLTEKQHLIDGEYFPTRQDLFDMSRCKDLLFPDAEHCYTIRELQEMLAALGLEFRGFQKPKRLSDRLWAIPPSGAARRSLDAWHAFEEKNPSTFGDDLYEMWLLKP